jgi:EmrB/QacA subfamily drug resistance transporter
MVILDGTIVNIALPSAQKALGFSNADRQWVITAYSLAFGSLLLLGGRISDLFGRKRVFITGLIGFAGASALGGAAQGFAMLVAARAVQGAFGALLAPAALSLLTVTFTEPKERARAFGVFGAIAGAGGAIGLLLGGILTQYASWRWCLFVNLFFAALAATGGALWLTHQRASNREPLDIPGIVLASSGLFSIVFGLSHADTTSWSNPVTIAFLAAGVLLLGVFVWVQTRVAHPLLPLGVIANRNRGGAYLAVFVLGAGMFGVFLFLTYYLQTTLGYSAVKTGLAFLPMVVALSVTATTVQTKVLPRLGPKFVVSTGMALAAVGMIIFTQLQLTSTYAGHILPGLVVTGIGLGAVIAPSMATATFGVRAADAGAASAMVNTSQQIGGSIGTALLNTIAAQAAAAFLAGRAPTPALVSEATLHAYTVAFSCSAAIFATGAVVCGLLLKRGTLHAHAHALEPAVVG